MADIQMSFPLFALLARGGIAHLDHINAWKARVEMRPAGSERFSRAVRLPFPADNGVFVSRLRNVFANSDAKNCCWIAQGR